MKGAELRAIRNELGMSVRDFAVALGYKGNENTISVDVRRLENNLRPIRLTISLLAQCFLVIYRTHGQLPEEYLNYDD